MMQLIFKSSRYNVTLKEYINVKKLLIKLFLKRGLRFAKRILVYSKSLIFVCTIAHDFGQFTVQRTHNNAAYCKKSQAQPRIRRRSPLKLFHQKR